MTRYRALLIVGLLIALAGSSPASIIWEPADQQMNSTGFIGSFGPFTDDDLYIGFDVDWQLGTVDSNEFYVLWFDDQNSQNIGIKGNQGLDSTDYYARLHSGDGGVYSPEQLVIPSTARLVGHLQKTVSGAGQPYNRFSLWVDPVSESVPAPVATTNTNGDTTVTSLGMRVANNNDTVWFRDIVIATTFWEAAQVTPPVPTPYAYVDFNDLAPGQLRDQVGGEGFSGSWTGSNRPQVVAGDLTSPLYLLTQGGVEQHVTATQTDPRHDFRTLSAPMTDEIWFSLLLRNADANDRVGLSLNPPTPTPFDNQGTAFLELRGDSLVYDFGTGTATSIPGQATFGETLLVIGQMVLNGGGADDAVTLWLDPDVTDGTIGNDTPVLAQLDVHFLDTLNHVGVFVYGPGGDFDSLYISDSPTAFYDVTGVAAVLIPEPTTLALVALGLLAARRRRV